MIYLYSVTKESQLHLCLGEQSNLLYLFIVFITAGFPLPESTGFGHENYPGALRCLEPNYLT